MVSTTSASQNYARFLKLFTVIDHRKRQNATRTSVLHLAAPPVPPFCSYHILMSSVTYKGHMTTWNLFGKENQTLKKTVLRNCSLFFTLILHILLGYSALNLLFKFQILNC